MVESFHDFTGVANRLAPVQLVEPYPIQPVESVIGLTTEEQHRREEDTNLTLDHISTPLQALDRLYINQPS